MLQPPILCPTCKTQTHAHTHVSALKLTQTACACAPAGAACPRALCVGAPCFLLTTTACSMMPRCTNTPGPGSAPGGQRRCLAPRCLARQCLAQRWLALRCMVLSPCCLLWGPASTGRGQLCVCMCTFAWGCIVSEMDVRDAAWECVHVHICVALYCF